MLMYEAIFDANVLARFRIDESPDLADRVMAIFETAERRQVALVVTIATLAEGVYVLESMYKWEWRTTAERRRNLSPPDDVEARDVGVALLREARSFDG